MSMQQSTIGALPSKSSTAIGSAAQARALPLAAALLLLAGYAFIMGPPATATAAALRVAAGAASGALALVFLIAAFGAAGRRLRRTPGS